MSYETEFGADWLKSHLAETLLAKGFEDTSWHNDICPSFTRFANGDDASGDFVRIWVDHYDPAKREADEGEGRFEVHVYRDGDYRECLYQGEIFSDALANAENAFFAEFDRPLANPVLKWAVIWYGGYEPTARIVDSRHFATSGDYTTEQIGKAIQLDIGETLDLSDLSGTHTITRVQ